MLARTRLILVLPWLLVVVLAPAPAQPSPGPQSAKGGVRLSVSATEVDEGDRLVLRARVASPSTARTITLQRWDDPGYGTPEWADVKTRWVRGKRKQTFKAVATAEDRERFRVVVQYRDAKPATSKPVSVTVWRWIPLADFATYYELPGGFFSAVSINGRSYNGYYNYGSSGSWEERVTAGRHCRAFRAVLGLQDRSDDGSSGVVKLTSEEVVTYESPALTPGMDLFVTLPLALPYRFGFELLDTSAPELEAWPTMGDPALQCTDVD